MVDASPSSQSSQSPLPVSYSPSIPAAAALLQSNAPSVRIYPAFNDLYRHQQNTPDTAQLLALHQQSASPSPSPTAGYPSQAAAYRQYRQPLLHQAPQMSSSAPAGSSSFSSFLSSSPSVSAVSASAPDVYPFLSSAPAPVTYTYSYLQQGAAHQPPPVPSVSSAGVASASSMSSLPSTSRSAAVSPPICDSVHLASFQMQAEEERWLMAEARKAEARRRQAEQQREKERRVKAAQGSSVADNLANTFGPLFSPFSAVRSSPPSEPGQGNRLRDSMKGLSLDSRPPSQREPTPSSSPASASSPPARGLLTDQFVSNEQFPGQRFVRHLVTGSDDLVDLAVRFDTTPELIRRHNRRVVFSHLDNVMNEFIHIPVKDSFVMPEPLLQPPASASAAGSDDYVVPGAGGLTHQELLLQSEINRQFFAVRSFLSQVARRRAMSKASGSRASAVPSVGEDVDPDCSEAEAEFYLQESAYNVHAALTAYTEDCEWEKKETERKKAEEASQRQQQQRQQRGAGAAASPQRRDGKSYASLALAIAQAKQQRLSALANDANAVQRQQEFVERSLRKRHQLAQKKSSAAAAAAASPFSINASQPLRAPLLSQHSSSSSSLLSFASNQQQQQEADVEDVYQSQLSPTPSPSFSYHQQSLTPSPAS